ncbi:MAG: hypothetical protein ACYTKD_31690, partial [Planctomycetota bacterium]
IQLDTDQTFHYNLVDRLVQSAYSLGADVLTGVYYRRMVPYWPLLHWWSDEGKLEQYQEVPSEEPFPIGAAGAGCLFVRRSVFDLIRSELGVRPFDMIHRDGERRVGEDMSFFCRLRELELKGHDLRAMCDPNIRTNHIMITEVLPMHAPEQAGQYEAWPVQREATDVVH